MTQGATLEEARENLMDALRLTLEVRRAARCRTR
jgi:predicted RNase H-like HicB family nuclease